MKQATPTLLSRRQFLAQTGAASLAVSVPYTFTASRAIAQSKNARPQFALIGVGGNGTRTAPVGKQFADLVALCDVDASHLANGNELLCDGNADLYADFAGDDVVMNIRHDVDNGILFEGELGRIFVNRGKLVGKPIEELGRNPLSEDAIAKVYRGMPMVGNDRPAHWANFIHAVEQRMLPISDVHSHMKMLNVCHLAGISCRLNRTIHWDQSTEQITGDELAASMMSRPYREGFEIDS